MKNGNQGDGGGRPAIEFTEEQTIELKALASVLTKGQLAEYFNISETTLRAIEVRQPEVSDAYKKEQEAPPQDIPAFNIIVDGRATNAPTE